MNTAETSAIQVGPLVPCKPVLSPQRLSLAAAMMVSAVLGVVAFVPALSNGFVYDDLPIIVENPLVTEAGPWYRFWLEPWWPRGTSADKLYRPLTVWTYRANVVLAGSEVPEPWSFHLFNLGVHALACIGIVLAAWRLTRSTPAGWIAGLLFATHPIHTEAVVTGYGRAELLAGCFAAWLLARYLRPLPSAPARRVGFHAINALLFLAAVMSKEHAAFLWPALALIDLWRRHQLPAERRPAWREWLNHTVGPAHAGFLLALAVFLLLRFSVFGWVYFMEPSQNRLWQDPMQLASPKEWLLTPFRLLWLTATLLVWPPRLCPIWSVPAVLPADRLASDVLCGLGLIAALAVVIWWNWHRGRLAGAILAGGLIVLALPVHALPLARWLFAERWLYLPTVLIVLPLAAWAGRWRVVGISIALALSVSLLPGSWQYGSKFADNLTMNREVLLRQPNNCQSWRYLASILLMEGRHPEAIQAAEEMVERFSDNSELRRRFGEMELPYYILLKSFLAIGDGRRALEALDTYERLRSNTPAPSLTAEREEALRLIAGEYDHLATVPTSPSPLPLSSIPAP